MKKRIVLSALAAILLLAAIGCANKALPKEGTYLIDVTLTGGTGKAKIQSPAELVVFQDGQASLVVIWSSDKYDYMKVNGQKITPSSTAGGSVFVIPVPVLGKAFTVIGDTTAMSAPHEVEYSLRLDLQ